MKVFVAVDMEGISGIYSKEQVYYLRAADLQRAERI